MNLKEKCESLNLFQNNAIKTYASLGFNNDNANIIFGIIIAMRNMVVAAEKEDTILLHKHMGSCAWHIVNYATVHNLRMESILGAYTHLELDEEIGNMDLENYLEKIKDDLSFVSEMNDDDKVEFIQKCWISTFPESYHDSFIKIDRILKQNIEDNKIKYPAKFA